MPKNPLKTKPFAVLFGISERQTRKITVRQRMAIIVQVIEYMVKNNKDEVLEILKK